MAKKYFTPSSTERDRRKGDFKQSRKGNIKQLATGTRRVGYSIEPDGVSALERGGTTSHSRKGRRRKPKEIERGKRIKVFDETRKKPADGQRYQKKTDATETQPPKEDMRGQGKTRIREQQTKNWRQRKNKNQKNWGSKQPRTKKHKNRTGFKWMGNGCTANG